VVSRETWRQWWDRDWHFVHHEIVNTEVRHDSIRSFKTPQHQKTQGTQDCRLRQAMTETATCRGHVDDIHLQVVHPSHDSPDYENIAYYATEFVDEMSPRSLSAHSLLHTLMKVPKFLFSLSPTVSILDFPSYPALLFLLHHTIIVHYGLSCPFTVHPHERRMVAEFCLATHLHPLVSPLEPVSSLKWLPSNLPFHWSDRPHHPGHLHDVFLITRVPVA